jgi:5-deoxy-glucuronate isomerase
VDPVVLRAGEFDPVTPESAGWRYLSFRIERVSAAAEASVLPRGEELALVVLSGSARAQVEGREWELGGRSGVLEGLPWAVYLPPGVEARIHAERDLELAVVGARSDRAGKPRLISPHDVQVEVRGAGSATRQVNHILPPEFPAHRLLVVEVVTPSGNWSSYPPHKHDQDRLPEEVELEEFYYFRVRPPEGFGYQRVYSEKTGVDVSAAVRDGDVMLVPYGYHVSGAPHGFDLYYLNGLAGDRRSMAAADDPTMAWIRSTWTHMEKDPRIPLPR